MGNMERQEQINFGERLLVLGVLTVLITEALFTILAFSLGFPGYSVLLGLAGFVVMMFLAAWLYKGSKQAWQAAVAWTGLQLLVIATPLVLLLVPGAGSPHPITQALGVPPPLTWLLVIKLAVYLAFGLLLLASDSFRMFLRSRHEHPAHEPVSIPGPTPAGLTLTEKQTSLFQTLSATFQAVGLVVLLAGGFLLIQETSYPTGRGGPAGLVMLEGVVLLILGLGLLLPAGALSLLGQSEASSDDLTQVFRRLSWLSVSLLLAGLALLGVVVAHLSQSLSS